MSNSEEKSMTFTLYKRRETCACAHIYLYINLKAYKLLHKYMFLLPNEWIEWIEYLLPLPAKLVIHSSVAKINGNRMRRHSFNTMIRVDAFIWSYIHRALSSHNADVAGDENEFDSPGMEESDGKACRNTAVVCSLAGKTPREGKKVTAWNIRTTLSLIRTVVKYENQPEVVRGTWITNSGAA